MRRRLFFLTIASCIILGFFLWGALPADAAKGVDAAKKVIKIAVVGPLTGQYGVYGQDQKKGVEYGIKEFNDAGGFKEGPYQGYKIEASFLDDKSDAKESANVAQQVVIGDYFAEIGPTNSTPANASAPIYDRANVAMVLVYASDYRLTHSGYKNVFRIVCTTKTEGEAYAEQAVKILGKKKLAELWENTAYGQTLHQYYEAKAKELGAQVVASDTYVAGQDVDFKPVLTKMKGLNPDMIVLNVTYNDAGLIVSQARSLGWGIPMLAAIGCNAPKFSEMMPADPGEVYMAVLFNQLSSDPKIQGFIKNYMAMHKTEPSESAALAYDALGALIHAVVKGAKEREKVAEFMRKVDYQGVTNRIRFDENGDVLQPALPLLKMGPGKKWVEYKK
jgi:branched-chain amino acid transport system substrate-binding protein